jgi:hypothetical protein
MFFALFAKNKLGRNSNKAALAAAGVDSSLLRPWCTCLIELTLPEVRTSFSSDPSSPKAKTLKVGNVGRGRGPVIGHASSAPSTPTSPVPKTLKFDGDGSSTPSTPSTPGLFEMSPSGPTRLAQDMQSLVKRRQNALISQATEDDSLNSPAAEDDFLSANLQYGLLTSDEYSTGNMISVSPLPAANRDIGEPPVSLIIQLPEGWLGLLVTGNPSNDVLRLRHDVPLRARTGEDDKCHMYACEDLSEVRRLHECGTVPIAPRSSDRDAPDFTFEMNSPLFTNDETRVATAKHNWQKFNLTRSLACSTTSGPGTTRVALPLSLPLLLLLLTLLCLLRLSFY